MPLKKPGKTGCDLNKISRQVLIESGIVREKQRAIWKRIINERNSSHYDHIQHAGYKGADCSNVRRVVYTVSLQHKRNKKRLAILLLGQANAYGAVHREVNQDVTRRVDAKTAKVWTEAEYLYAAIQVFMITIWGLAWAYQVMGGVIRGGGLDPYYYIQ